MRRRILIAVLAFGTVGGFASGFASMRCHGGRQQTFEEHVADVCVAAAKRQAARAHAPELTP